VRTAGSRQQAVGSRQGIMAGEKKLALLKAAADAVGVDLGAVLWALRLTPATVPSHVADDLIECLAGMRISLEVVG